VCVPFSPSPSPRPQPSSPRLDDIHSQKNTSSHATGLEKNIAAQALSHGKLTIMRKAAEEKKAATDKAKAK